MRRTIWLPIIAICLSNCAGKPKKELDLAECISRPGSGGFLCGDGNPANNHVLPYEKSEGYVARHPLADQAFWDACLLQKKGVSQ